MASHLPSGLNARGRMMSVYSIDTSSRNSSPRDRRSGTRSGISLPGRSALLAAGAPPPSQLNKARSTSAEDFPDLAPPTQDPAGARAGGGPSSARPRAQGERAPVPPLSRAPPRRPSRVRSLRSPRRRLRPTGAGGSRLRSSSLRSRAARGVASSRSGSRGAFGRSSRFPCPARSRRTYVV